MATAKTVQVNIFLWVIGESENYHKDDGHCVKSVRIPRYSGPHFPAFGLNMESYSVSPRIQSEWGKIRTRITPNTDTCYAVGVEKYDSDGN